MECQHRRTLLQFVMHGDRQALETAKKHVKNRWDLFYWGNSWEYLGPPEELSDEEKRAMEAAVYLGAASDIAKWLKSQLQKRPTDEEACLAAVSRPSAAARRLERKRQPR